MISFFITKRTGLFFRLIVGMILSTFILSMPGISYAQMLFHLPVPGAMVGLSGVFTPPLIRGIVIDPENPLQFDFLVASGTGEFDDRPEEEKREEYLRLIKYFLAALTLPEEDLWVNLSPYEPERIIPENFARTEMGRDLLGQDYILKQLTASLMYPEKELGKEVWAKIYDQARARFGTTQIPVDTFNKVWIVLDSASVYEQGNTVFLVDSHLKVMLEEDYMALQKNAQGQQGNADIKEEDDEAHSLASQIVKEVVIPVIEQEVNEGENFALLRQISNSLVLAIWYKRALKESLLGKIYADKSKTEGVEQADVADNQRIYDLYLEAFKQGVFNYIKEDYDPLTEEMIPRKYFSGGFVADPAITSLPGSSPAVQAAIKEAATSSPMEQARVALKTGSEVPATSSPVEEDADARLFRNLKRGAIATALTVVIVASLFYRFGVQPINNFWNRHDNIPGANVQQFRKDVDGFMKNEVDLHIYGVEDFLTNLLQNYDRDGNFYAPLVELKDGNIVLVRERAALKAHMTVVMNDPEKREHFARRIIAGGVSIGSLQELSRSDSPFKPMADHILNHLSPNEKRWINDVYAAVDLSIGQGESLYDFYGRMASFVEKSPALRRAYGLDKAPTLSDTYVYMFFTRAIFRYLAIDTLNALGIDDQKLQSEIMDRLSDFIGFKEKIEHNPNAVGASQIWAGFIEIRLPTDSQPGNLGSTIMTLVHEIVHTLNIFSRDGIFKGLNLPAHYDIQWLTATALGNFSKLMAQGALEDEVFKGELLLRLVEKHIIVPEDSPFKTYIKLRSLPEDVQTWQDVQEDVAIDWVFVQNEIMVSLLLDHSRLDYLEVFEEFKKLYRQAHGDLKEVEIKINSSTAFKNDEKARKIVLNIISHLKGDLEPEASYVNGARLAAYAAYYYGSAGEFFIRLHGLRHETMNFAEMELAATVLKNILAKYDLTPSQRRQIEKLIEGEIKTGSVPDQISYVDLKNLENGITRNIPVEGLASKTASSESRPRQEDVPRRELKGVPLKGEGNILPITEEGGFKGTIQLPNGWKFNQEKKEEDASSPAGQDTVGGIDLNPENLNMQIKRDGNGVPLPMQDIQNIEINGFIPIIINITPVYNLPLLLGVHETPKADTQLSHL